MYNIHILPFFSLIFGNTSRKGKEESEMAAMRQRFLERGAEKTNTDAWNRNGIGPILQEGRAVNLRTRCDCEAGVVSG